MQIFFRGQNDERGDTKNHQLQLNRRGWLDEPVEEQELLPGFGKRAVQAYRREL